MGRSLSGRATKHASEIRFNQILCDLMQTMSTQ
ncbi:hypothetical protein J2X66_001322 [Pseudomonas sp. 3296]|nr:hypothetical protein [Pseudomonas sp. 3296]